MPTKLPEERARGIRQWLSAPAGTRPSWRWATLAAIAVGACFAVAQRFSDTPADEPITLQPDQGAWPDPSPRYRDFALFVRAGHAIWSGDMVHVYDNAAVQTGPLALLWAAGLAFVFHYLHVSAALGFAITAIAALTPTFYAVALWSSRHTPPRWLYVVAGASLAILIVPWKLADLIAYQHLTYLWVPALWLLAASFAREGRVALVGLTLAASCGLETWGTLAVPVLLLALPSWLARARAAVVWAGATCIAWAPFYFSGNFRMFDHQWKSGILTPVHAILGDPEAITWEVRVFQALVIVGASIITWRIGRRMTDAATVALAILSWTRVITDGQTFPYYRLPLFVTTGAILLAASAYFLRTRNRRALPAIGITGVMMSVAQAEVLGLSLVVGTTFHLVALTTVGVAARGTPDSPPVPEERGTGRGALAV